MTTIGGVAFRHLDRLPMIGDSIGIEDIVITILEMDEHRIHRVRVNRGGKLEESSDDEALQEPGVTETAAADDSTETEALLDEVVAGKGDQAAVAGTNATDDRSSTRDDGDDGQDPQRKATY